MNPACPGPLSRRNFLKLGGLAPGQRAGITPWKLGARRPRRSDFGERRHLRPGFPAARRHMEMYDLKPDAPSEGPRRIRAGAHQRPLASTFPNICRCIAGSPTRVRSHPLDRPQLRRGSRRRRTNPVSSRAAIRKTPTEFIVKDTPSWSQLDGPTARQGPEAGRHPQLHRRRHGQWPGSRSDTFRQLRLRRIWAPNVHPFFSVPGDYRPRRRLHGSAATWQRQILPPPSGVGDRLDLLLARLDAIPDRQARRATGTMAALEDESPPGRPRRPRTAEATPASVRPGAGSPPPCAKRYGMQPLRRPAGPAGPGGLVEAGSTIR